MLIYAVYSDALPVSRLDDYAYTILAQQLSTSPGVSQVSVFGQKQYAARVEVDPGALAAHSIGLEDVRSALAAATVNAPKGSIEGSHQVTALDINDQLFNAAQFGNVIIAYRHGAPVRVKDIGDAVNSVQNIYVGAWFNNRPAEGIAIQRSVWRQHRRAGRSHQTVDAASRGVDPAFCTRRADVGPVADHTGRDRRRPDHHGCDNRTGGSGHLHLPANAMGTAIPSMAVPLSLLATIAVMYVAKYSLDNISLMALTISVGFVVDDAIVMIENIVRYIEQGERPFAAALRGAGQIGFTIISITFSLIAVFIPLFFMGGIIGRLFREFAVTVSVAVIASAAISLTLTPVLCSLFLKRQDEHARGRFNRGRSGSSTGW